MEWDAQAERQKLEKLWGRGREGDGKGDTNYVILSAFMVGRQRTFFILNRLKWLEKLNICRREVRKSSINK